MDLMLVIRCCRYAVASARLQVRIDLGPLRQCLEMKVAGTAIKQQQAEGALPDTSPAPTDQAWLQSEGVRWMTPMAANAGLYPSLAHCLQPLLK